MRSTKKCSTCKEVMRPVDFDRNVAQADGLQNVCRECMRTYRRPPAVGFTGAIKAWMDARS